VEKPQKEIKKHHLVYQGNPLIEGIYRLKLNAKKTMLYAIAQIQPDDDVFKFYMINVDDYKKLAGIKGRTDYFKELVEAVRELRKTDIEVYDAENDVRLNIPFAVTAVEKLSEKTIGFSFPPELRPYLLQLKATGRFTRYRIGNVMKMRSVYSIRLYELLKQYANTETKERTFELNELRNKLGVPDDKLVQYFNFKKFTIEVAKRELPKKTDISFTYKQIKQGRTVKWLRFTIKPLKKTFIKNGSGKEIDVTGIPIMLDIPEDILQHVPEQLRCHHDILRDITDYLESHGENYVLRSVAYTKYRNPVDFAAYLGTVLKKDLGAKFNPKQLRLFPEIDTPPMIAAGMKIVYQHQEYTIDENDCIWPESGGCLTAGPIIKLIQEGKIRRAE